MLRDCPTCRYWLIVKGKYVQRCILNDKACSSKPGCLGYKQAAEQELEQRRKAGVEC